MHPPRDRARVRRVRVSRSCRPRYLLQPRVEPRHEVCGVHHRLAHDPGHVHRRDQRQRPERLCHRDTAVDDDVVTVSVTVTATTMQW